MKILKVLIICFLFLVTAQKVSGQKGFKLQAFLQPQMSMINGDYFIYDYNYNSLIFAEMPKEITFRLAGGVKGLYMFTEKIGLSLGFMYSSQGQKYETFISGSTYTELNTANYSVNTSYYKIPLSFEVLVNPEKKVAFAFSMGIYMGLMSSYEIDFSQTYKNQIGDGFFGVFNTEDKSAYINASNIGEETYRLSNTAFKSTVLGGQLGAGVLINVSDKISIPVSINYDFDFGNIKDYETLIIDHSGQTEYYWDFLGFNDFNESYTNATLGLRVGVQVNFGKGDASE